MEPWEIDIWPAAWKSLRDDHDSILEKNISVDVQQQLNQYVIVSWHKSSSDERDIFLHFELNYEDFRTVFIQIPPPSLSK